MADTKVEKRFWLPKEAADYVLVSTATLYAWVRQAEGREPETIIKKYRYPRLIGPPPPFRRFGPHKLVFPVTKFKEWADQVSTQG